jgi:hypothetical protein
MKTHCTLIIMLVLAGCKRAAEPVGWRPKTTELVGEWTLANSPTLSGIPAVPIPTKGNSVIFLHSNLVADLTNVLIDELFLPAGKTPPYSYRTTLKTNAAAWDVEEMQGLWSIVLKLTNQQTVLLPIQNRTDGGFQLNYQPDPEREPFIYTKNGSVEDKR